MPMSATYRAKEEHSILLVKIVNRYFERQPFFWWRHLRSVDRCSVKAGFHQRRSRKQNTDSAYISVTYGQVKTALSESQAEAEE